MQAIEFVTTKEKGMIKIPKEYLDLLNNEFRVIILVDPIKKKKQTKKKLFSSVKIDTKGFKFNRDEANER